MADKDEGNNGILGLDRAPVPKAPGDPSASDDADQFISVIAESSMLKKRSSPKLIKTQTVSDQAPRASTWDPADKAHTSAENR